MTWPRACPGTEKNPELPGGSAVEIWAGCGGSASTSASPPPSPATASATSAAPSAAPSRTTAEGLGYGVVRAFVGHGIGRSFHSDPQVFHYDNPTARTKIEPGMTFTIEPMSTMGAWQHEMWDDGWTAVTTDRSRTAQFEHTLLITDDGAEVLTKA